MAGLKPKRGEALQNHHYRVSSKGGRAGRAGPKMFVSSSLLKRHMYRFVYIFRDTIFMDIFEYAAYCLEDG